MLGNMKYLIWQVLSLYRSSRPRDGAFLGRPITGTASSFFSFFLFSPQQPCYFSNLKAKPVPFLLFVQLCRERERAGRWAEAGSTFILLGPCVCVWTSRASRGEPSPGGAAEPVCGADKEMKQWLRHREPPHNYLVRMLQSQGLCAFPGRSGAARSWMLNPFSSSLPWDFMHSL